MDGRTDGFPGSFPLDGDGSSERPFVPSAVHRTDEADDCKAYRELQARADTVEARVEEECQRADNASLAVRMWPTITAQFVATDEGRSSPTGRQMLTCAGPRPCPMVVADANGPAIGDRSRIARGQALVHRVTASAWCQGSIETLVIVTARLNAHARNAWPDRDVQVPRDGDQRNMLALLWRMMRRA